MLKRFMYAAIGLLALALAFQVGANSVAAQGGRIFVGILAHPQSGSYVALTQDGEVWASQGPQCSLWSFCGTIGGGVSVESSTWGQIKHRAGQ